MTFQKSLHVNLSLNISVGADVNESVGAGVGIGVDFFAAAVASSDAVKVSALVVSTVGTLMDVFLAISVIW